MFIKPALLLFILFFLLGGSGLNAQERDDEYQQAKYQKIKNHEVIAGTTLLKTVIDADDNIYVLSDAGLYWVFDNELIPDRRFRPLQDRVPIDITVQEGLGHLYYLYEDHFLSNGNAGKPYGEFRKGMYQLIAVSESGRVLLAGGKKLSVFHNGEWTKLPDAKETIHQVKVHNSRFYLKGQKSIFVLQENGELSPLYSGNGIQAFTFRDNEILIGTFNGYLGVGLITGKETFGLQQNLPVPDIKELMVLNGKLWAGTEQGIYYREDNGKFRYYASKKWLDKDNVIGLAADSQGNVLALTPTGLNKITFPTLTLAEKAAFYEQKIRHRHLRYGFSTETRVMDADNLGLSVLEDDDNDGLWTSFYLGSMAFKYAAIGDEKARRYAWESFEAFERLLSVNQLEGFPSRTFERTGFKVSGPDKWRDSPDTGWEWKGHTSSDEFVGYIFVAAVMDELVAETESEKKRIAAFIDEILMHLIDNDYYFVDIDGEPTLWGRWNPEYINWYPETVVDRKLGSITLIAGLQLGYALTGKEIYKEEAYRLMEDHGYLDNIKIDLNRIASTPNVIYQDHNMGDGGWNHSDDEMAFLSYWVLYHYAFDDKLKKGYAKVIHNHWKIELPERNALWSTITYGTEGSVDMPSVMWHLRGFPLDLVRYNVKNSHRKDLEFLEPDFRGQTLPELIHQDERRIIRHNNNPFELDGGRGGTTELTGEEFLLPYWMAVYLGLIK